MQGSSLLTTADLESQELEKVQAAFLKTPRLAKLLSYLVDHYFEGRTELLTEFNIAVEVFGRDASTFIASEDAIARVETHRLRKKLKLFYENDGRQHALQISIPLGTYVPVFTPQKSRKTPVISSEPQAATLYEAVEAELTPEPPAAQPRSVFEGRPPVERLAKARKQGVSRTWRYAMASLIAVVVIGVIFYAAARLERRPAASDVIRLTSDEHPAEPVRVASPIAAAPVAGVAIPFRMIAGYSGPPQRDAEGALWQADQYYQRGWPLRRSAVFVRGASDPLIFQYGRAGDADYDIPMRPGSYEVHLYFVQAAETALGEDAEDKAIFNLQVNGKLMLDSFDIVSDAMGRNTADERVFRDISPAADGKLHLHLSTVVGTPSISAIAVFEGTPGKLLPVRLVTQPTPRTDRAGLAWRPDNYFVGGRYLSHNLPSTNLADPDLRTTERYGHFAYAIPVDPRDNYTVSLYFEELFLGTAESGGGGIGSRVFRVMCNGETVLNDFDVFKEAGSFHLVKKTFYHVRATSQGKINLTFEPIQNYATVSAIEVTDEAGGAERP